MHGVSSRYRSGLQVNIARDDEIAYNEADHPEKYHKSAQENAIHPQKTVAGKENESLTIATKITHGDVALLLCEYSN